MAANCVLQPPFLRGRGVAAGGVTHAGAADFDGAADLGHTGVVKTASAPSVTHLGLAGPRSADTIDARTRDRVTQLLIELGPSTAAELSRRLGLSPAGIR